jgi:hypothetical protein
MEESKIALTDKSVAVQVEYTENSCQTPSHDPILMYENLSYGQNGLGGILRSPYVFGAALLASMGGFSFGYGM